MASCSFVSGYIVTFASSRERVFEFSVKRLFRVAPALGVAVGVVFLARAVDFQLTGGYPAGTEGSDLMSYVRGALLLDMVQGKPHINGVTWTLVVEVAFYVLTALVAGATRRTPGGGSPANGVARLVARLSGRGAACKKPFAVCEYRTMRHKALKAIIHATEAAVGRRRLAQFARLVTNEVRLDVDNDLDSNGEGLVQRAALASSDPVILDVGGHFGEWSMSLLAQTTKPLALHVFEPSEHSARRAAENLGERATVHPLALSDRAGDADLVIVHEGAGSNSLVAFADNRRTSGATETVTLATLDEFCGANGITHVSLLKIDAEGHDLAVLRGGVGMLREQRFDMIQFEYNHRWIDARVFLLDAFDLLDGCGYRMGKVTPRGVEVYPRWHHELETFTEANFIAYLPKVQKRLTTIPWWGG